MTSKAPLFESNSEIQGGIPVFAGTRVPVRNLIECLVAGETIDEFLADFPSVSREQAEGALRLAGVLLTADVEPA